MTLRLFFASVFATAAALSLPVGAARADYRPIADQQTFVTLVAGKRLTSFGVDVAVTAEGAITGRAFGRQVTGTWRWADGYFCRDLAWGPRDFDPNCQTVAVDGRSVRFTSDRGQGDSADLTLR